MTSKPDLGLIVAVVSGIVIIAAIIAGLVAVGGPGDARERRLDDLHYQAIGEVATAAQCVYAETGVLPASIEEARLSVADISVGEGECARVALRYDLESVVGYDVAAPDHINLCADFRRPTAPGDRRQRQDYADRFPELAEPRTEIGRRCYLIQVRAL